jgi:DNA-binding transcriptional ArsR family regulator
MNNSTHKNLSYVFKALGHPRRLQIIDRLIKKVYICCEINKNQTCCLEEPTCDFSALSEELHINKSTLSLDLKELRNVGLIHTTKNGRKVSVQVNEDLLAQLKLFFDVSVNKDPANIND